MRRSRSLHFPRALLPALCAFVLAACGDSGTGSDDQVVPTEQLVFLRASATAPPLAATQTSFWAKRGEDRELRLYYRARAGASDSTEFLRFRVRDGSLLRRPDGTAFAVGDSIRITVTVVDLLNLIVDLQPSGLRFNPSEPAELKFKFSETDDDLDDDGRVDDDDRRLETQLAIWRRESITEPWVRLASRVAVEIDEIEADILGFTNYAIAYRR